MDSSPAKSDSTDKDKYSFIVYSKERSPQMYQISKGMVGLLYYGFPFVTLASLLSLAGFVLYFDQIRLNVEKKEPVLIAKLRTEKTELETQLNDSLEFSKELQKKLLEPVSSGSSTLSYFKITPGFQDYSSTPVFGIEEGEAFNDQKNIHFRFNIINLDQNSDKRAGFVWVLFKSNDRIFFYPAQTSSTDEFQLNFSEGESFATTRFRPVEALFPLPPKGQDNFLFKVLIFSRTGDLVHKQTFIKNITI
jgi:hypothetical protein